MTDLVLARVGRRSLHDAWAEGDGPRDWHLRLLPFEPLPPQDGVDCVVEPVVPGPKWSGLRELLQRWDGWREYDRIWLPDDDLLADSGTITRMFDVARAVGLDLFAPALHESSFYAHFDTMRNLSFEGRWTGFVEIMAPGFSSAALQELLPTLDASTTGWGWGLDSVWPKLLGYRNVGVIDATPVMHTRPVGALRDAKLALAVHAESDRLLAAYGCRQEHVTYGAFGPALTALPMTPEELLVAAVEGWSYLIGRDPRVLAWIAAHHGAHFGWPPYPAEGTPAVRTGLGAAAAVHGRRP